MRFATAPIFLVATALAFPQLKGMRRGQGGGTDPSLIESIINGIEGETTSSGTQGGAPLDPIAPITGPLTPKRSLIGGVLPPLTGLLAGLDVPTPQPQGLALVPDHKHPYIKPGKGDVRGLCPTLNTLANHGYISRNGVTTFAEAANAIQTAYSISYDLAVVLSALGLLAGGDLVSGKYSIAGQVSTALVPATIGPAYGIDSHGRFEEDVSITRGDTYFGNNHDFNLTRWNQLVAYTNEFDKGLFSFDTFKQEVAIRWDESKADNPEFFSGVKQFIVRYAVRVLTYRPLANGTTPNLPNYANISPFFLKETFPDYWYRRAEAYSLADLMAEVLELFLYAPKPLGRNINGVFTPFQVQGPETAQDVQCFLFAALLDIVPDDVAAEVNYANQIVTQILTPIVGGTCNNTYLASTDGAVGSSPAEDSGSGSGIPAGDIYDP